MPKAADLGTFRPRRVIRHWGWDVPPVPGQRSVDLFNPVPPVFTSERTVNIGFLRKNRRWHENPASHPCVMISQGACGGWKDGKPSWDSGFSARTRFPARFMRWRTGLLERRVRERFHEGPDSRNHFSVGEAPFHLPGADRIRGHAKHSRDRFLAQSTRLSNRLHLPANEGLPVCIPPRIGVLPF